MREKPWLRRFAWFTATATLFLICSGGMVTSKGVGLAVPDWPTTFGYNMFLFPVSKWVGGIFFEHTHRLIASTVGMLTIVLALWLSRTEERRWLRNLGWIALGMVVLQGVLGGLRVTMLKDQIGIFHACVAHAFLALLVVIAVALSPVWRCAAVIQNDRATSLLRVAIITTVLVYVQLILGATMRHQHRDLSIVDFPTAYREWIPDTSPQRIAEINRWRETRGMSDVTAAQIWLQMAHRAGALLVAVGVVATLARAIRHGRWLPAAITRAVAIWFCLVCTQLLLGAWTIWSNKAADVATTHVAVGATMLAFGVGISVIVSRLRERAPAAAPHRPLATAATP